MSKEFINKLIKNPINLGLLGVLFIILTPGLFINVKLELPLINNIPIIKEIPNYILHSVLFVLIYVLVIASFGNKIFK